MLKGKHIDLRLVERDDIPLLHRWYNDTEYFGDFEPFAEQVSRAGLEKHLGEPQGDRATYIIQKKDGTAVGDMNYRGGSVHVPVEIGYAVVPTERGKGYATEGVQILVDYLFLTRDIQRVQATTSTGNVASQRSLEKAGFRREGELRKSSWARGQWQNDFIYSILRDDWGAPRLLKGPPKAK